MRKTLNSKSVADKQESMKQNQKSALVFYISMVSLPLIHFAIFYVAVNLNSVLLAFKRYDFDTGEFIFVGLNNFTKFLNDITAQGTLSTAVGNSLILYVVSLIVGIPLTLVFSFYIYKKMLAHKIFRIILFLPSIVANVAMVIMYTFFVERLIPAFASSVFNVQMSGPLSSADTQFGAILFFNIWAGFGGGILMYGSAMSRIPEDIVEYSRIDGFSYMNEFVHITLPLISQTISTFLVVGVAAIFTNQASLYSFYGSRAGHHLQTIGYNLFIKVIGDSSISEYPYAAAGGLIFTLIAAPLTLFVRWILDKVLPDTEY